MSDPVEISAARVQAIVDDWIDILANKLDDVQICGRFADIVEIDGVFSSDPDCYYLQGEAGIQPVAVLPLAFPRGNVGGTTEIVAHAGLVYTSSTAAASQPTIELISAPTGIVAVASGSTITAPAEIGWHFLEWTGGTPLSLTGDVPAFVRWKCGNPGDRVAMLLAAFRVTV